MRRFPTPGSYRRMQKAGRARAYGYGVAACVALLAVLLLAGCAGDPIGRPTQYTKVSPPPVTAGECWILKRDGVWYDCR